MKAEDINIPESYLGDGWYAKPHYLLRFATSGKLSKSEYILLDLLLHFENWHTKEPHKWFFVIDKKICSTKLMSPKTLVNAKRTLKKKGLIDCKPGYSHHATEYRILFEGYYRGTIG